MLKKIDSPSDEFCNVDFCVRSKIWIEDSRGKVIFGLGRYRILDAIRRLGSMNAAAKELQMSYRAVWMRIRSSEKRGGMALIVRDGKGSRLTPFAENMMKQYRRLLSVVQAETDEVYASLMTDVIGEHEKQNLER
jgi:molybdate transport system regulatory protein